ncbi:MAG: hypothetical protein JW727_04040 [Candidatus Aenigmarchaeota archaeon]|nr:hypothetical protein [Candidatus Aenigmarchaeota archaeon]
MPSIEETADELQKTFSSGGKECTVAVVNGKIELDYFNEGKSAREKKILSQEEAELLIDAVYKLYGLSRGQSPNPAPFKGGIV